MVTSLKLSHLLANEQSFLRWYTLSLQYSAFDVFRIGLPFTLNMNAPWKLFILWNPPFLNHLRVHSRLAAMLSVGRQGSHQPTSLRCVYLY